MTALDLAASKINLGNQIDSWIWNIGNHIDTSSRQILYFD